MRFGRKAAFKSLALQKRSTGSPRPGNHFVHKGDTLFEIDPEDFRIALDQAQAQRDSCALDYARANASRQTRLAEQGWTSTDVRQQTTSAQRQSEAVVASDMLAIAKRQLDLSRTVIRSPVNGYVTNLLVQLGDYVNVGQKVISVIDTDSYWVDGDFEESSTSPIVFDPRAKLTITRARG